MVDKDLDAWICQCVAYLKDKRSRIDLIRPNHRTLENHPLKDFVKKDFDDIKSDIEDIQKALDKALKKLNSLVSLFEYGSLKPFEGNIEAYIRQTRVLSSDSWAQVRCAQISLYLEHPNRSRKNVLAKDAVALAFSYNSKRARHISKILMEKAGIEVPDEKTISNYLKEIKNEAEFINNGK